MQRLTLENTRRLILARTEFHVELLYERCFVQPFLPFFAAHGT